MKPSIALIRKPTNASLFCGLFLLEFLLKHRQISLVRLLTWLSIATLLGMLALLLIHTLWVATIALFVISLVVQAGIPSPLPKPMPASRLTSGVVRVVLGLGIHSIW